MSMTLVRMTVAKCALVFMVVASCVFAEDASVIDLGSKDVAAYLVAPDAHKLLDVLDAVAKQFMPPEQYKPGMMKMVLGMQLGDPTLANLGDKPVVLMVFKLPTGYNPQEGPPPMALYLPAVAAAPYDKVFNQGGATDFADGVLTAVPKESMLKAAAAMKPAYEKIAAAKVPSQLRLYISATSLMDTFGPMLKAVLAQTEQTAIASIKNTPPPPGLDIKPEMAEKLAKLALRGAGGILNQLDWMQIDVKLDADALTFEQVYAAKPGTLLATALTGTAPKLDTNLEALVGKGTLSAESCLDMVSMSAAWKKIIEAVAADPELADLSKDPMVKSVSDILAAMTGTGCVAMKFDKDGMAISNAVTAKDPASYLELQSKMLDMFNKDSLVGKLYAQAGMNMNTTLDKKARVYKGVDVSRLTITMDGPAFKGPQKAQMDKMLKPTEVGAVKTYVLSSNNPERLNSMIDMASSGTFTDSGFALKSKTAFGAGKNFYMDYDFIALMKSMSAGDPANLMGPVFAKLEDGTPVLIAGGIDKAQAKVLVQIPLGPIAKMTKAFQDMAKGMQNGAPPKQKKTEDGTF